MTRGLLTGDTSNLESVAAALDGAYGVWVNIDGFTVGEQREIYAGIRIFELAKQTKSLRHYVWSSLGYNLKVRVTIRSTVPENTVLSVCGADGRL
jgi:hypothetical protein